MERLKINMLQLFYVILKNADNILYHLQQIKNLTCGTHILIFLTLEKHFTFLLSLSLLRLIWLVLLLVLAEATSNIIKCFQARTL